MGWVTWVYCYNALYDMSCVFFFFFSLLPWPVGALSYFIYLFFFIYISYYKFVVVCYATVIILFIKVKLNIVGDFMK